MSELQEALDEYLAVRRALGFKLSDTGRLLPRFVRFIEREGASFITTQLALRWATEPKNAQQAHWARRLSMVRLFAQYRSATDPRTEIPSQDVLPYNYHRKPPYIYTDKEIVQLMGAAEKLSSPTGLRPKTCSTLFGLLAVTGMRISEAVGLDDDDVDLKQCVLTVRGTKFGKSRLIPIHSSTQCALRRYTHQREKAFSKPKTSSFFVSDRGTRLVQNTVQQIFVQISHQIGLRGPSDSHGPRLHDFRHTMAVRTLVDWFRAGVDVEQRLPKLATYLGHVHVTDTYWYLSATPELLQLAVKRLDNMKKGF
jgi:integrase/recombinase XerD